ncbi:MAG: DUF3379 family protein [Gammaproteobacteria bacterium]|nr:DUF3379 family protein [Gammaproteobacteria bacterium]
MTCIEFRQHIGAVPRSRDAEILRHRMECRPCAEFAREQERIDAALERALRIAVPDELPDRIRWRAGNLAFRLRKRAAGSLGLAASLLLALGVGFGVWTASEQPLLADEVVAHVLHEPELLLPTSQRATAQKVNAVMGRGGLHLDENLPDVAHAGLCPFRGRLVPHLVLQVDGEPVSVLFLRGEVPARAQVVHEDGFEGIIVPTSYGAMAIVAARADLVLPVRTTLERAVSRGI